MKKKLFTDKKNSIKSEKSCYILSTLLLFIIIYLLYIFKYNKEYCLIIYVFYSDILNIDLTINTTNKITDEKFMYKFYQLFSQCDKNYFPSYFVISDINIKSHSIPLNFSENIPYKNYTVLSILDNRSKIEQECILKLEKVYRLKIEEYDTHLAK
jgi:hypothetical protein